LAIADIEQGKTTGEFSPGVNSELLVDAMVAPAYYRLLLRFAPLTEQYGEDLINQALRPLRLPPRS